MKSVESFLLTIIIFLVWLSAGFFIAGSCGYSISNSRVLPVFSLIGMLLLGLGVFLVHSFVQVKKGHITAIVLYAFGLIFFAVLESQRSKMRLKEYGTAEFEFFDVFPPNWLNVMLLLLSVFVLLFFAWKKYESLHKQSGGTSN